MITAEMKRRKNKKLSLMLSKRFLYSLCFYLSFYFINYKLKERERREKMADLIDELRVLIPNCGDNGKKLNQSNVMSYAVEYIKNLHSAVVEMKQEIFFLKGIFPSVKTFSLSFSQLILGGQGVCPPSTPLVPSLDRHMNQNNSEENEPTQEVSIASKPDREAKKNGSQSPQVCFHVSQ